MHEHESYAIATICLEILFISIGPEMTPGDIDPLGWYKPISSSGSIHK